MNDCISDVIVYYFSMYQFFSNKSLHQKKLENVAHFDGGCEPNMSINIRPCSDLICISHKGVTDSLRRSDWQKAP